MVGIEPSRSIRDGYWGYCTYVTAPPLLDGSAYLLIAQHFSSEKGLLRGGRAEKRAEVRPADSVAGDSLY